ncbi:MAG: hypothetical protein Faunusvirus1_56 [Faunusvirus sp.]|jgi:hypothetical protein|uniref:Uncharacterized protein n=1 Tax=Faunusvirus sp. TaxID=2487766 RepID=A0A3G4ZVY0_9VIRU|nr:MAG: hypothetical protein Faunusvirus1_56 [Faunusvirus sp.]
MTRKNKLNISYNLKYIVNIYLTPVIIFISCMIIGCMTDVYIYHNLTHDTLYTLAMHTAIGSTILFSAIVLIECRAYIDDFNKNKYNVNKIMRVQRRM